jgi:hypothetical protein
MSDEELNRRTNPRSFLTGPIEPFDAVSIAVTPPPVRRPKAMAELPTPEELEAIEYGAIPVASEEPAPHGRTGLVQGGAEPFPAIGATQPLTPLRAQLELAALVTRIESALGVIHAALAEIKRLQNPPPGAAS